MRRHGRPAPAEWRRPLAQRKDEALAANAPVERWRVAFAIVAALAALPLLAIDNVSSHDDRASALRAADGSIGADGGFELLASRASAWGDAREARRRASVAEAIALGEQAAARQANAAAARVEADVARVTAQATSHEKASTSTQPARSGSARAAAPAPALPRFSGASSATPREPSRAQWARLRDCESDGDYRAVSAGGRFRGAYQFDQATWDSVVEDESPDLIGVDPASASPSDQDAVALALYRSRGAAPWPRCGYALR